MKANQKSRLSDLSVDVVEYMFIEWLVRQGIFSAYKANFEKYCTNHRSFRENLRAKIRFLTRNSILGAEYVISTSFLYHVTPEGRDFWIMQSKLWQRFCGNLKSIL